MENLISILTEGAGSILGFIVALVPAIILHEMGHMFMAKWLGVWVQEFGIGFPPRIKRLFRWQETEFTLNWLPFGGFARLEGELYDGLQGGKAEISDEETPPTPEELQQREEAKRHSLNALSPFKRIPIFVAGPTMNFVLAFVLAVTLFLTGYPEIHGYEVIITDVVADSPAAQAGLRSDDELIAINGEPIEEMTDVTETTSEHLGREISLTVLREGEELTVSLVPRENPPAGEGAMGVAIGARAEYTLQQATLPQAIVEGGRMIGRIVGLTVTAPIQIIRGLLPLEMARPVGVINASRLAYATLQESIERGILMPILELLIIVNVSLGIFNLVPLPVLDGGHVVLNVVEGIRKRPLSPRLVERVIQIAMVFFIALFLVMIVVDILYPIV